jgi:phosphomannomutase
MSSENELIVSVSGIRGIIGAGLTPTAALTFAQALGERVGGGIMILGTDGRPSGNMLRHAVIAGLLASGCEVQDVGVAPTPTVGLAIRECKAAGGLQITASHNPAQWNGLKLFGSDGRVLSAKDGEEVRRRFEAGVGPGVSWRKLGSVKNLPNVLDIHRNRVLQLIDAPRIRSAGLRAFLDANGGAGGPLALSLLEACQVTTESSGAAADGIFLHEPEPTEANLRDISPRIPASRSDIGFALDPDSDRLALIDETGRYIGEELTLALAADFRLKQERGPVVINMSTSRVVEDVAARHGCPCYRSAVGEANVADLMIAKRAVFGGEGNGGVIDPRVGYVRDPFIGMGLILQSMAESGRKLSELVAALPAYAIVKDKHTVDRGRLPDLYAKLRQRWPEARSNDLDGLRLDWSDRWVHLRPSNTEPIVRVIAEAPREADARQLCGEVAALAGG